MAWYKDEKRHSKAAKGIKTGRKSFGAFGRHSIKLSKSAARQKDIIDTLEFDRQALELPDLTQGRRKQLEAEIGRLEFLRYARRPRIELVTLKELKAEQQRSRKKPTKHVYMETPLTRDVLEKREEQRKRLEAARKFKRGFTF